MSIRQHFLDISRPALTGAVEFLATKYDGADAWDLSSVAVVVPGARAGRRLLERLVDAAQAKRQPLVPPRIETTSALPELLYRPKRPFANGLTQQLAWARALREQPPAELKRLITRPPQPDDAMSWLAWGDLLRREHTELAGDGLQFGDVAARIEAWAGSAEAARWQVLAKIQASYLHTLDSLELWDRQTARLKAIEFNECRAELDVVLLGTVDLNRTMRTMLDEVRERVTVLVHADATWQNRFDTHGCVIPDEWSRAEIPIDDDRFQCVDGPVEQAEAVVRRIAAWNGAYRLDELTVGFADESLVSHVERQLTQCGLPARWGPGRPIGESAPIRLLAAVAQWLRRESYASVAAIVRHPDVTAWLQTQGLQGDWLTELDRYYARHLPGQLVAPWLGDDEKSRAAAGARAALDEWLRALRAPPQPLDAWRTPVTNVFSTLYGNRPFHVDDAGDGAILQTWHAVQSAFDEFDKVPESLRPTLAAADVIELVLTQLASDTISLPARNAAVELLGWLEIALDDAPGLIVTTFNEGFVPTAVNSDPFLPNSIRHHLGLDDNARRYARDAYAVSVIMKSRPAAQLVVARRNARHDPIAPSRLLFAADAESVARRARAIFTAPAERGGESSLPGMFTPRRDRSAFVRPTPREILAYAGDRAPGTPLRLRATDFRAYLNCPYRFLLDRVARLEALSDDVTELDPLAFGTLAHDVLHQFGESDLRDSEDADVIAEWLSESLATAIYATYGAHPRPAVQVQWEQLQRRLLRFAQVQAARTREGWRIAGVERDCEASLEVDGIPLTLIGRIDRFDRHIVSGDVAVFDYKTSDSGDGPGKTRQKNGTWLDLQLPLYRHLVRSIGVERSPLLGYVTLPKDIAKVRFEVASWTEEELQDADELAWDIVRSIRAGRFELDVDRKPSPYDSFARICQVGVLR